MNEPRPCPFCGHPEPFFGYDDYGEAVMHCGNPECSVHGPGDESTWDDEIDQPAALERWNKRHMENRWLSVHEYEIKPPIIPE
jgi:hypothetical protein